MILDPLAYDICYTWQSRSREWFRRDTNGNSGVGALFKHLDLPVVDFLLLGQGKIGLDRSLAVVEGELCPVVYKQLVVIGRLEFPCSNAFFLN